MRGKVPRVTRCFKINFKEDGATSGDDKVEQSKIIFAMVAEPGLMQKFEEIRKYQLLEHWIGSVGFNLFRSIGSWHGPDLRVIRNN